LCSGEFGVSEGARGWTFSALRLALVCIYCTVLFQDSGFNCVNVAIIKNQIPILIEISAKLNMGKLIRRKSRKSTT
jgi:hypothetical protein